MLSPLRELLQGYNLVLASTSVQRKAIWEQVGLKFTSIGSPFDEESVNPCAFSDPKEFVKHLAQEKASAVVKKIISESKNSRSIVVGADTVIVDGERIIGKPHTESKAIETLENLSGRIHNVCTGVAIFLINKDSNPNEKNVKQDVFVSTTDVEFASLSTDLIQSYVKTGEPLNKAGAYGIQGQGALLVKGIRGDYYNVVGFPIQTFCQRLEALLSSEKNT